MYATGTGIKRKRDIMVALEWRERALLIPVPPGCVQRTAELAYRRKNTVSLAFVSLARTSSKRSTVPHEYSCPVFVLFWWINSYIYNIFTFKTWRLYFHMCLPCCRVESGHLHTVNIATSDITTFTTTSNFNLPYGLTDGWYFLSLLTNKHVYCHLSCLTHAYCHGNLELSSWVNKLWWIIQHKI